ncbi:LOW QUALITY PROTEIN: transient-receptor-potential-like protein [Procambarus clarkii]|uniref:LOW QUALITY PROTEIN: transient-receptor-potential-like protein n=1 Tax=Procambarus clarkii TaxID=6728 RepID=UPI00374264A1
MAQDDDKKPPKKSVSMDEKCDLDMEEGSSTGLALMPDLPKPLTLEEKKFLLAVERGDCNTTRKMLQKAHRYPAYMNMNCVDPLGRGALHMSIANENLEMVELLVVMGVETRDALLHAIDAEFVEAVEVLLEHEEVIHKDGELYSWEKADRNTSAFTPEITPLILAAHRDNYEILKILLDRGATLPMPHDIRCGCPECIKSSSEDSLRHSRSRINAYRALASPSLIALSSTDPILTAFQLSLELKNLAYTEHEFRFEYLELRTKCMKFAEELLSHARSSRELAVMLNHDPDTVVPYEEGKHMTLKRLELAIDCKQKKFVAHPNIQQLLAALWYEGVPGFRRKAVIDKCLEILKVVVLFPFYCMWYMVMPDSPTGRLMRTPFMKFLTHSSSYLFFLMLLILVSVRFENLVIWLLGTESMRRNLEESMRRQRGNLPTPIEGIVALWVIGFLWEEAREIHSEGFNKYIKNMWNILDILRDTLYSITIFLRIFAFIQQSQEIASVPTTAFIPREEWDTFDPHLISEGLFSAANILSALKLVHIFSINPYLGPLQISLGRMVIDIVKFFFIYSLVLFAFACGLTQLLWYYNDLEKNKCYSLPGGLPDWTKQSDACLKWRRFHNLFEASQSLFWAGFGMVGLSDFELTGIREYTRFWSMLMFGSYSVINIIVLLNLLIAMMSNSYSFIVEHADTEWKFARTKLWMSYFEEGNTLPPPFNIFPTLKSCLRLFGKSSRKQALVRKMSSRTQSRHKKARDYRYLSVMRALIWRYVCSLQRRNEERPVNEDDISEVKGDISSLRFELIDLFGHNGMDISLCAKKSRAALGRKMRVWERRLMRDFHVSPAMGADDSSVPREEVPIEGESAADKFRRIARLAMAKSTVDTSGSSLSQIGSGCDQGRESLKMAMDRARKKMEEGTPDGSPGSSRGCSPFPDLYTGPHLLEAIKNLDLSPHASPSETPLPTETKIWSMPGKAKDGQAKDPNMLTVPGRRSSHSLKRDGEDGGSDISLDVPVSSNIKSSLKVLSKKKTEVVSEPQPSKPVQHQITDESSPKPPATITSVSEKTPQQVDKIEAKLEKKEAQVSKTASLGVPLPSKIEPPVYKEIVKAVSVKSAPQLSKGEELVQKKEIETQRPEPIIQQSTEALKPSQIKARGFFPSTISKRLRSLALPRRPVGRLPIRDSSPLRIPPPACVNARRGPESEHAVHRPVPLRPPQVQQQTFTGSDELEDVDFVRRPSRLPPKQKSPPPTIAVIPSTPKPTETPVPLSPPAHKPVKPQAPQPVSPKPAAPEAPLKQVSTEKDSSVKDSSESIPIEKAAADDVAAEKAIQGSPGPKPSTPPAAAFRDNTPSTQSEPLLKPKGEKKGGWL